MRNIRAFIMLLVAALAGLAAVVLASRWMMQQSAGTTTKVVVASTDINLGQRLSPEFVKVVDWPRESLPPGALTEQKTVDGRVTKNSVMRGEPILESKLTPAGTRGGLSAVIADGKRAITVRVNDVVGVAGFALPGSFVDIIVNTQKDAKSDSQREQSISKIVLEKILVLAVAQEVNRDETKPKVVNAVTLEVSPEEAEKLDLARSVGSLSLVLRNQIDPRPVDTAGATKRSLLNEPVLPAAVAAPVVKAVQVVHRITERKIAGNCVGVISGMQQNQECF
ncbi:Flp pilus assembly protein CpaB [Cupriavidus sp. BIC8F]|uniref:Flp pilus assembly protein CpaB n=1 Tax=Cupriavidus sp. BIC8F TaxID=3079014 RepID=UPI002915E303|nr:Flp pilus assembly protein CpaB [Cupriavidus sp. BIC8F]